MLSKRSSSAKPAIPISIIKLRCWMKNKAVRLALHLQDRFGSLSNRKKWFSFISFWLLFSSASTWHILSGLAKTKFKNITVTPISSPIDIKSKSSSVDTFNSIKKLRK